MYLPRQNRGECSSATGFLSNHHSDTPRLESTQSGALCGLRIGLSYRFSDNYRQGVAESGGKGTHRLLLEAQYWLISGTCRPSKLGMGSGPGWIRSVFYSRPLTSVPGYPKYWLGSRQCEDSDCHPANHRPTLWRSPNSCTLAVAQLLNLSIRLVKRGIFPHL
ncbi:hypothetical protein OE88DRAFT_1531700 [Heliocybe sulcata]|uniref:Uncharacterized protein n=1 Tax=Heliocybe sulcata TaxID=5364 RepID=A0A5C3NBS1_9AGAM|nr:hypothetical protein OE88DRAFT_1531700 [Heliocybe sulcata]